MTRVYDKIDVGSIMEGNKRLGGHILKFRITSNYRLSMEFGNSMKYNEIHRNNMIFFSDEFPGYLSL